MERWEGVVKGGILTPKELVLSTGLQGCGVLEKRMKRIFKAIDGVGENFITMLAPLKMKPYEAITLLKEGRLPRMPLSNDERAFKERAGGPWAVTDRLLERAV